MDDETYQIILGPGAVSRVTTTFRELLAAGGGDGARGSTAGRSESGSGSVGKAGGATSRTRSDAEALAARGAEILAPAPGAVVDLADVPDKVFSGRLMGDGFAIDPTSGDFRSPVSGRIATLFPTGHAFAVVTPEGLEVLVHIGLETVKLKGEGFTAHHAVGDEVRAGDVVISADLDAIRPRVPSLLTPVVVLNTPAFPVADRSPHGDAVLTVARAAAAVPAAD
ncbi:PTS glucose transporter subunit IIA [Miniimonas sp. S16]|uniref:PTS sugar transporter subunit IIA n=1 Tax=Miniimonas sp. S16 TaxID=2171623 RepID=UPI001901A975|nr:PTS glucose transporter subunit IIA [Miniimonas sp. S16]